MNKTTLYI